MSIAKHVRAASQSEKMLQVVQKESHEAVLHFKRIYFKETANICKIYCVFK